LPMIHPLRPKGESQFASNRNPDSDFSFDALGVAIRAYDVRVVIPAQAGIQRRAGAGHLAGSPLARG
jgi:hypothetical protein